MLVLIADDCSDTCDVLCTALRMDEYEVHCALTSEHALKLVGEYSYHAILLDLWMPGMDGYALAKAIRRVYINRQMPRIIALSGAPYDPSDPCAAAAAFDGFIGKPVDLGMLSQVLATDTAASPAKLPTL